MRKYRYALPSYLEKLAIMFQGTTVDGKSSYVAGQSEEPTHAEEDDEFEEDPLTPSNSSRKRVSSTTDTTTSPRKKKKSPVLGKIDDLITTFQGDTNQDLKLARQISELQTKALEESRKRQLSEQNAELDACLELAKECGATEDTHEIFVATKLFQERYNRQVFLRIQSTASRMSWLRLNAPYYFP